MITDREPYFMTNESWYRKLDFFKDELPEDGRCYLLTDEAPEEAVASYIEYYGDSGTV